MTSLSSILVFLRLTDSEHGVAKEMDPEFPGCYLSMVQRDKDTGQVKSSWQILRVRRKLQNLSIQLTHIPLFSCLTTVVPIELLQKML